MLTESWAYVNWRGFDIKILDIKRVGRANQTQLASFVSRRWLKVKVFVLLRTANLRRFTKRCLSDILQTFKKSVNVWLARLLAACEGSLFDLKPSRQAHWRAPSDASFKMERRLSIIWHPIKYTQIINGLSNGLYDDRGVLVEALRSPAISITSEMGLRSSTCVLAQRVNTCAKSSLRCNWQRFAHLCMDHYIFKILRHAAFQSIQTTSDPTALDLTH